MSHAAAPQQGDGGARLGADDVGHRDESFDALGRADHDHRLALELEPAQLGREQAVAARRGGQPTVCGEQLGLTDQDRLAVEVSSGALAGDRPKTGDRGVDVRGPVVVGVGAPVVVLEALRLGDDGPGERVLAQTLDRRRPGE